jgi:hypothetical protein
MRLETYQMRVMDGNCGWGGQTLGARAADVGCYHGYLPFDVSARPYLADKLMLALSAHGSPDMPANEFWVRQMPFPMSGYDPEVYYDVLMFHVSDLAPFASDFLAFLEEESRPGAVWDCVRPGGAVILFVGPTAREMNRALALVKQCRGRPEPELYAVREYYNGDRVFSRALVWSKIDRL